MPRVVLAFTITLGHLEVIPKARNAGLERLAGLVVPADAEALHNPITLKFYGTVQGAGRTPK